MTAVATSSRRRFARVRGVVVEFPFGPLLRVAQDKPAQPLLPPRAPMQARPIPDAPLGDPAGDWREPARVLRAVMSDGWVEPDGPEALRFMDAAALLDLHFALSEWGVLHPDPAVRAYAQRLADAGEAVLRGDKDADGRAVPVGRILGLQPAAGSTAAPAITRKRRDDLLRRAREAVPLWRDAPPRQVARAMLEAFERYRNGAWQVDRERDRATAPEPAASFWRLIGLNPERPMPGTIEGLARALDPEL